MTTCTSFLLRAGRLALDAVLPPHCAGCDGELDRDGMLCPACFARASFVLDPSCDRCARPFAVADPADPGARVCDDCDAAPPDWNAARAALVYDDFSRALILPLKYADRTENARVLGAGMARAGQALLAGADLVLPVPLHRWRLLHRRYNQAALLARAALREAGLDRRLLLVDGLLRQRRTRMLAHRSAAERRQELDGAIAVNPARRGRIDGARVVLVDDVLTTGATAGACARALHRAGAAHVGLLVAARTVARA